MRIEPVALAQRVERWQKRLAPLGVGHFRILSVSLVDETPSGRGAIASCQLPPHYDSVRFYFTHDFLEDADMQRLEEVIIHEWLHVAWRDFDESLRAVEAWMPEATYEDFKDSVEHEEEGLIDRLARILYAFYTQK